MKKDCDVIIIGAGPSGSAAAKVLVDNGLSVIIIDKKKLPRYKICSGVIFKKSLEITEKYFGPIPESLYLKPKFLKGVRMWADSDTSSDWPFDMDCGGAPNVWRSEYDYWLVKNTGAKIIDEAKLIHFEQDENGIEITYIKGGNKNTFNCNYLISAEGSLPTVRTIIEPKFENSIQWFIAYQNYCKGSCGLDPLYYHGFLDEEFADVYAWFNVKSEYIVYGDCSKKR